MSSNAAPSPGRSAARCLNRTAKLSGSTSALGVAMGVTEEVDEVVVDGRGAQLLVTSRALSMESLEGATMEVEVGDMVVTQEGMEEAAVVDVER